MDDITSSQKTRLVGGATPHGSLSPMPRNSNQRKSRNYSGTGKEGLISMTGKCSARRAIWRPATGIPSYRLFRSGTVRKDPARPCRWARRVIMIFLYHIRLENRFSARLSLRGPLAPLHRSGSRSNRWPVRKITFQGIHSAPPSRGESCAAL